MSDEMKENIISTATYYNELNYPLTVFEMWKYLTMANSESNANIQLCELIKYLESDELKKYIEEFEGFYFLKGRKDLLEKRLKNNKLSDDKLRKLKKFVSILSYVPFVRMIALTGRMAMKNAEDKSDWDLFIVLKARRIWIGRTLITILVQLLGKRRHGNKIKDRICLNYFSTDQSLEIRHKDIFSANEYYFMVPLFGKKTYQKFMEANQWIREFKPNFQKPEVDNLELMRDNGWKKFSRKFWEIIFDSDWLEEKLRRWEKKKIESNPKTYFEGSFIEASDSALIFFPEPKGPKIFENFKQSIEELKRGTG
jgi:hypothetical protein